MPTGGGPGGTLSVFVEKDQAVMFSLWSSHHDPEVFSEDAWDFLPERWENLGAVPPGYFPFNFGPRVCLGRKWTY